MKPSSPVISRCLGIEILYALKSSSLALNNLHRELTSFRSGLFSISAQVNRSSARSDRTVDVQSIRSLPDDRSQKFFRSFEKVSF